LPAKIDGGMIPAMGRDHEQQGSDLFSAAASSPEASSSSSGKQVTSLPQQEQRHVLPKDLPSAIKHLSDHELNRLLAATLEETKRRGKMVPNVQTNDSVPPRPTSQRKAEVAEPSLTRGQINAVRAAFKAGVKPLAIARQFGISQSDIRKVLSDMKG
jgi:hypothetical protein